MSLRTGDRDKNPLVVLDKSKILKEYTLMTIKRFPKSTRWLYSYPIAEEVRNIRKYIEYANATPLSPKLPEDAKFRRNCQIKARASIANLYDLVEDVYNEHYISGDQSFDWNEKITETSKLLNSWIASDEKRLSCYVTL